MKLYKQWNGKTRQWEMRMIRPRLSDNYPLAGYTDNAQQRSRS